MKMNSTAIWILCSLAALGGLGIILWDATRRVGRMVRLVGKLPVHPSFRYGTRDLSQVDQIIFHHTAGSQGPKAIADYHVQTNGWPGIGYHFVIDAHGTIYQTNELSTLSYHCKGQNTRSIGIALIGNFELTEPSPQQYEAARQLVRDLRKQLPQIDSIAPHKQYRATACPGKYFHLHTIT